MLVFMESQHDANGTILSSCGHSVVVRLEEGTDVQAIIPKDRFGCLFGSLVGWKVRITIPSPPQLPRVMELTPPPDKTNNP